MPSFPSGSFLSRSPAVSALRVADYRRFWLSATASGFGLNLWFLVASWQVLMLTDSQLQVGLVGGLAAAPSLVLSLIGGALTDRVDRRRILLFALGAFGLLCILSGALDSTRAIRAWHLLVVAVAIGVADAASNPAWQTLLVELLGKQRLLAANALGQLGEFSGEVIAPLLGGLLIAAVGSAPVYGLAAGALAAALLLMAAVRPPHTTRSNGPSTVPLGSQIREGLAYTLRTPPFPALLLVSASSIFGATIFPLIPVYARDELAVGAGGFGVLAASIAAGMMAGALLITAIGEVRRRGWTILGTRTLWFGAMAGFALSNDYGLSIALLFVMGASGAVAQNLVQTWFLARADDRMRGRVMSIVRITDSFEPLGFVVGGALASSLGNQTALLVSAALGTAVLLLAFVSSVSLRAE